MNNPWNAGRNCRDHECAKAVYILSMGENTVHPLYKVHHSLSTQSIVSILSTPIAPALHQKPTQINWIGGLFLFSIENKRSTAEIFHKKAFRVKDRHHDHNQV